MPQTEMPPLAIAIDDFLIAKNIHKTYIADRLGLSRQGLFSLMHKKNFSLLDAQKILDVIDCHIEYTIVPNNDSTDSTTTTAAMSDKQ